MDRGIVGTQRQTSRTFECECGRIHRIQIFIESAEQVHDLTFGGSIEGRHALTSFERKILRHVAEGQTDRELARLLGVSVDRVRYAVRSAVARLGARTRSEAVFRAVCSGQIEPELPDPLVVLTQNGAQVRLTNEPRV